MAFVKAGRAEEVPPGRTKLVRLGSRPVLLANWGGRVFALDGLCPHQGKLLDGAAVWDHVLDCPWHHFQFDVRTGENLYPRNVYPRDMPELEAQVRPLRTYPVHVQEGEIWVDLG